MSKCPPHDWHVDAEYLHESADQLLGYQERTCRTCGGFAIFPVEAVRPVNRAELQAFKDWLASAEDGSFADSL